MRYKVVRAKKPMRHSTLFVSKGDYGIIVEHDVHYDGGDFYDYYVSFKSYPPFGVFKKEIELVKEY